MVSGSAMLWLRSQTSEGWACAAAAARSAMMRRIALIAIRDFVATVSRRGFLVGLLLMPALGVGIALLAPKLRGDQLSFSFFTKPNDNATRHQFTGTVKGETVEGVVKVGDGASQQSLPWTAKMVERKAGPQ